MNQTIAPKRGISTLIKLFISTFYISAFTFGGGYVMITFMKQKFVDQLRWIDNEEMLDLTAIAQSSPGVIAVNAAIMVGLKVHGFIGMIVAIVGTILPPMIVMGVVSFFYQAFATNTYVALVLHGMQAGVAAVIINVVVKMALDVKKKKSSLDIIIMIIAFIATYFLKVNVMYVIISAIVIGVVRNLIQKKKVVEE